MERRLSLVEELEATVTANLQRATRIRQSVLHRAFSGNLLSNDRPAGVRPSPEMPRPNFKYAKPPIQEAICEIHFVVAQPLSSEQIGQLKEIWAAEYSDQKLNKEKGVKVEVSPDGVRVVEDKMREREGGAVSVGSH